MTANCKRLLGLKAWQLKHAAFLMGLPSTGTKIEVGTSIHNKLSARVPFNGGRVVSVDMGIRNLALCVLEVPPLNITKGPSNNGSPSRPTVLHWLKKDLLATTTKITDEPVEETPLITTGVTKERNGRTRKAAITAEKLPKDAFTPSNLSKTAYAMTMQLLSYKPDVILIERQRFRSGGSAAILEWTVRVNMLESMLWACLQTMREIKTSTESKEALAVYGVSPQRVASFWTSGPENSLRPTDNLFTHESNDLGATSSSLSDPKAKRAVRKTEKIAIVRSWLEDSSAIGAPLTFSGEGAKTAAAFQARSTKGTRAVSGVAETEPIGKLDDLADCLLQAVAWVRWEENSRDAGRLLPEVGGRMPSDGVVVGTR